MNDDRDDRFIDLMAAILLTSIVVLGACVSGSSLTGAAVSLHPGECGAVVRLEAAAGVPLTAPVGEWIVEVQAEGGAVVTLRPVCEEAQDGPDGQ